MKNLMILAVAAILSACSYKVDKIPEAASKLGSNMGFSEIQALAFGPKCSRCHDWTSSYEGTRALADQISMRVQSTTPGTQMPPATAEQLTAGETAAIVAWVAAGAPKEPGQTPPPAPKPEEPPPAIPPALSFASVQANVFGSMAPLRQGKCIKCHKTTFDTYEHTLKVLPDIEWHVLAVGEEEGQMPPPNKPQLTDDEKALLLAWVRAGAPEHEGDVVTPPAPPPPVDPVPPPAPPAPPVPEQPKVNFALIKAQVLDAKCLRCHKEVFDAYDHMVPFVKDMEFRVQAIGQDEQMPPANKVQLTDDEKILLLGWLRAGAPKD